MNINILGRIKEHAQKSPGKLAFQNRYESLTYYELEVCSNFLAQKIKREYGTQKSPIVVFGHKQKEMLISFIACAKLGRAYIPIDDSFPKTRVLDIIENANAKLMIEVSKCDVEIEKLNPFSLGHLDSFENAGGAEDVLYIIYTSGSTGKPKGVQISHQNLDAFLTWLDGRVQLDGTDVVMSQAPFSFDLSVMDLYLSLMKGCRVFCVDNEMIANPKLLFSELQKARITFWISTPSLIEYCLADRMFSQELLPHLKGFLFIGEVFGNACAQKIFARFKDPKIYNGYGPTESTVMNTMIEITQEIVDAHNPLPIGYEENGVSCEDGEIVISGLAVSRGYLHDTARTEKVFFGDKYKTGDLGSIKDGMLFFAGRKDNQIKLSGYRIETEEIENKINSLPYVTICAVVPKMQDTTCKYLAAFVVLAEGDGAMLKADLRKLLPAYMLPKKITFLAKLPEGITGKVDRNQLKAIA